MFFFLGFQFVTDYKQKVERHIYATTSSSIIVYKDRAAPPVGGPALHDSRVNTVQWREREGHASYQEVEIYMCM